ncbi:hypothetical protein KC19_VG128600 [Ceratodon purpureus]|uniref:Uncharacterized protein n=1 Tax=Ceratodon purpureus TaxID=3225 RepID=A0A8T0HPX0_CERPU|nr:hypothetical protein KC19_VG128600 [Ceratodon purpureus]
MCFDVVIMWRRGCLDWSFIIPRNLNIIQQALKRNLKIKTSYCRYITTSYYSRSPG